MRNLLALLCTFLAIFMASTLRADTDEVISYSSDSFSPSYNSRSPISLSWIFERYDFDWIESHIDQYYGNYYKTYERLLASKQRELAGKFGLSNIFLKPNFRTYAETKVIFTKRIWHNKLRFRYLAPVGDMRDFDLGISLKPYRFVTVFARGNMNGNVSIALVVNKPLGRTSRLEDTTSRTRKILVKAKRLVNIN